MLLNHLNHLLIIFFTIHLLFISNQQYQLNAEKVISVNVRNRDDDNRRPSKEECEEIRIPFCKQLPYNRTNKQNRDGRLDQDQILNELFKYESLYKLNCSAHLESLVCSLYLPLCTPKPYKPLAPCKELCDTVKADCIQRLEQNQLEWPDELNCNKFQTYKDTKYCFIPPNEPLSSKPSQPSPKKTLTCPIELRRSSTAGHGLKNLKVADIELDNCTKPCLSDLFNKDEDNVDLISNFILFFSLISLLVNSTLLFTYLIDRTRFEYPLKAIIHISLSYLIVSIVYLIGYLSKGSIQCDQHTSKSSIACNLSYLTVNFFINCSLIWWLVLTVTFYLEMAKQWATEVIERKNRLFCYLTYVSSALLTFTTYFRSNLRGDLFTGLCHLDLDQQLSHSILPASFFLIGGLLVFIITILKFFKLKSLLKSAKFDINNFQILVNKLLVFLFFYLIAYVAQFLIYYYEISIYDLWVEQWYKRICEKLIKDKENCPNFETIPNLKPSITFALFKYSSYFLPGLASCSILFTKKTPFVWLRFFKGTYYKLIGRL